MKNSPNHRVITHDGYRANQTPVAVIFDEERYDISAIEDSWISTGVDPASEVCYGYVVKCRGGSRFRVEHTEKKGWRVEILPGPRLVR
jgi:hypothetical protein